MVYIYNPPSYGYAQFFGPKQQMVSCPKCKQQSLTQLEYVKGRGGWLGCTMFAGFGISFCCCAPIPFYCDNCKDVKHYCGMCNTYIGKYVRDGRRPVVILPPELYGFKNDQPTN
uniref:LITAF domain-containing protein n=1 Tax=Meloidogyne hapla TaxID=6305 RepID=A0A1I8BJY6_MELHA